MSLTIKEANFEGKTSSKAGKILILPFSCAIVHEFMVIQNYDIFYVQIFRGPQLRRNLWSQLTQTAKTSHFEAQSSLEASIPHFTNFRVL